MNELMLAEIDSAKKVMQSNNLSFATIWATEIDGNVSYGFNFDPKPMGYVTFDGSVKRTVVYIVHGEPIENTWIEGYRFLYKEVNNYITRLNELLIWDTPTIPKENDVHKIWNTWQLKCDALLSLIREVYPHAFIVEGKLKLIPN